MSDFTGHTPGPWEVEYGQLHPASQREAYTIRTDAFDVVSGHLAIRREEDARLIAAAPDLLAERDRLQGRCGELRSSLVRTEDRLGELARENVRLREALDHALKGDMDPDDRMIVAQILDGTALQEAGDAR